MLQKLGYVEIGTLPGQEGCLASTIRTRYGGRHQSQDGLECKEPEVCPIQRVNAGLAARAAKWDGDKDWDGLGPGTCARATPPACPTSAVVKAGGKPA